MREPGRSEKESILCTEIFSDLDCAKGTGEGEGCITDPGGLRGKSQSSTWLLCLSAIVNRNKSIRTVR
ncbi:uncharacterized protein L3040_000511 [Drepanopeziza brunnea f. sp. 'multigermtubi']|uniref:uncharacterized protein n=1 Tax=Drepanopeziza brunnea f. sp. 'multigermtubi' TaxID=698441 RepID=UPI0023838492|nr:hypothetical protein L3040_000511 [Drepanopeziza brunnea f. sp. 'multigermtubi']